MTTLLAASGGGHLKQLSRLHRRLPWCPDDLVWVTFDSAQSRSLLAGADVHYVEYAAPRDLAAAIRNARAVRALLRDRPVEHAVSTGASVGVSALTMAAARRIPSYYIESAARADGPSLSGRLLAAIPRVHTYTQYERWSSPRWPYAGSVFDGFRSVPLIPAPEKIGRAVVTVGSQAGYAFRRLVEAARRVLPASAEVLWQTGSTPVDDLPIEGRVDVPAGELEQAMREADVVIAHAGVGSALSALETGRCPVLVPRAVAHREHVDDHQFQIAEELRRRELALTCEPDGLDEELVLTAAARCVEERSDAQPLRIVDR
jgi:UDP-N-acetylglucosamine--N-acetylmuramyl-(pentapeptide) pyrophosphoryl-undecaprenol N-acetylglucosamine transferase